MPFRRPPSSTSRNSTPNPSSIPQIPGSTSNALLTDDSKPDKPTDLLLHSLLAPALANISTDDILSSQSSSLTIHPPASTSNFVNANKRGPRGKDNTNNAANGEKEILAAPGTLTALAIASSQQAPEKLAAKGSRNAGAGATQGQWVLGKSLAELKKMESASQLEVESDWARIQGSGTRGRRTRGD